MIIETESGAKLVKLRGAAQGTGPLVAEIIVGALADALGLPVPARSLVSLPPEIDVADWNDEVADLLAASTGINLGFNYLDGARDLTSNEMERLPMETKAKMLWLDRLVLNPDRTERNPNLLWWSEGAWLIDHGAALRFQYNWRDVTEDLPRQPSLMPEAHLFEAVVPNPALREADDALTSRLTRDVIERAVAAVPEAFLGVEGGEAGKDRRRAAYAAYIWKRLRAPRPFLDERPLPIRQREHKRPAWLERPQR